jgi:hypothetical protein
MMLAADAQVARWHVMLNRQIPSLPFEANVGRPTAGNLKGVPSWNSVRCV